MSIAQRFQESGRASHAASAPLREPREGAAVRTGMLAANGRYAVFTDADNDTLKSCRNSCARQKTTQMLQSVPDTFLAATLLGAEALSGKL